MTPSAAPSPTSSASPAGSALRRPAPAAPGRAQPADLAAWNRDLNRTHAMAQMRARAGRVVRGIEARRRRLVAEQVRRLAPRTVVDVGCEDGWIAEAYVDVAERVLLCDLDPTLLAVGALAAHPRVEIVATDALAPDALEQALGGQRADVIVLSALLEHLPEPARALAALSPLLAEGAHWVVYLPADGPILLAKRILKTLHIGGWIRGLSLDPAPGHLHRFARRDVQRLLQPFGALESLRFDPVCLGYLAVVRAAGNQRSG